MALQPVGDRIVVKPLAAEEKTKSGLIVPDAAKEKPQEGKVIAVGKGKLLDDGDLKKLEVKVGERIVYGKYSGSEVRLNDTDYVILREEDILAIVD